MTDTPDGFEVSARTGAFVDLIGPLLMRMAGDVVTLRLRVDDKHLNARGRVHGAIITALLDLVMGRNVTASTGRPVVTASLTASFLSAAQLGDWLEASGTVTRAGRTLAFALGTVAVDERPVATAAGTFAFVQSAT